MRITIRGTVQGVGFRPAVYRAAERCGASGAVWNDGSDVVIDTDSGDGILEELLASLPPLARIESVEKEDVPYTGERGFSISPSGSSGRGASIPADSAVCDECLKEIFGDGRRSGYPFTTCTGCGPRFTLLKGMPYDRPLTSMESFPLCPECGREYSDPADRRFHHQTVCCPECGPKYRLELANGTAVKDDPIGKLARMLDEGSIAVVKGWGGMYICCSLDELPRMREWYGRRNKPFAVMAGSMEALRRYASPTEEEEMELLSPHRPIVLVEKKRSRVTELMSPGLDNVGMFLPYAGMHHILFSRLEHDALVMTSANIPGEPMIVDDEAVKELGADAYLLHDQPIVNRADDSVLRMFEGRTQFIRRSRGHVPFGLSVPHAGDAVALGAQENLTGSVASRGKIWPTQHIGNGENIGVPEYLEEAVRTQIRLVGCSPQIVAEDLHPGYSNRRLARRLAEEYGAEIRDIQHHWGHAAALMADNSVDSCVALALDGTGHGDDGKAWGGEVMSADFEGYRRVAHLEEIPLLGSERALYDLRRLGFAIDAMNGDENRDFTDRESAVLSKLMGKSVATTSMGRLLDALSFYLGVCTERTYDGEPAMRLEPLLAHGRLVEGFETETVGGVVKTAHLFSGIRGRADKADVAYSIVHNVMQEMVQAAVEEADRSGIGCVGITGGVSYNAPISKLFRDMVKSSDHLSIQHKDVPNGDGGISVGQAAIALRMIR
ncbi:MAG: carbamoyltransferase HypF [Candidatus Methanomethylophilaceae archaeon]|nr:carbamoyltransferase HypF [Candidatus Methanomethylophilaceae archaeon]